MSDPLKYLIDELAELEQRGLLRDRAVAVRPDSVSFCSNDYLGLARLPAPEAPAGSGASRLIAGEREEHRAIEAELARWLELEDALVFTSGYAANVGVLSALAKPGDLVVSDALNHASLIDGIRLCRAARLRYAHADMTELETRLAESASYRVRVIVTHVAASRAPVSPRLISPSVSS